MSGLVTFMLALRTNKTVPLNTFSTSNKQVFTPIDHQNPFAIKRQVESFLPTEWGDLKVIAYSDDENDVRPTLAMIHGELNTDEPVLVRIHSECMTGDVFHSQRCECGEQLDAAMRMICQSSGIVLYLRQEGRGIGLINKLKAYNLQDKGMDTADANVHLGFEVDSRDYEIAIQILKDLGVKSIKLITNNPDKIEALEGSSIELAERVPIQIAPKEKNRGYLQTKKDRLGHFLDLK